MEPDEQYWREFYESGRAPRFPSQFAIFVQSWIQGKQCRVFEFGAGNGRDALFFHSVGHIVHASDQVASEPIVELAGQSARFFSNEGDVAVTSKIELPAHADEQVVVYSRFFQHAIPEDIETAMIANLAATLPQGALAFFEFRIDEDADLPKTFGGHFRRYQPAASFAERVSEQGFAPRYQTTGSGFANYRDEDPIVGRFVFEVL